MLRPSILLQPTTALLLLAPCPVFAQEEPEAIPDWFPSSESAAKVGYTDPIEIQYWRSLTNRSTAGSLIPITIIYNKTNKTETRIIYSDFLIYHFEKQAIKQKRKFDREKTIAQIIKTDKLTYRFSHKEALKLFGPGDTPAETEMAKSLLSKYTNDQLVEFFLPPSQFEMELAAQFGKGPHQNLRYAIAHALFSRGLCVGLGCVNGSLWVRK